jgi:hypothetical protein
MDPLDNNIGGASVQSCDLRLAQDASGRVSAVFFRLRPIHVHAPSRVGGAKLQREPPVALNDDGSASDAKLRFLCVFLCVSLM